MILASERPGVYSDYSANGILNNSSQSSVVGIVAVTASGEKNKVYDIKRESDAKTIFGDTGLMITLCKAAIANGASVVKAVSCGGTNDYDYDSAFNTLKAIEGIKVIVCDSEDSQINGQLKDSVVAASENLKERIGIAACSVDSAENLASNLNCERIIIVCQSIVEDENILSPCVLAAALAGKISSNSDPSASFNGCKLSDYSELSPYFTEDDIDLYLESGVTVFEKIAGKLEVIRLVTSRTTDSEGNQDRVFYDINTILIADDVIASIRSSLSSLISSAKNNSKTLSAIATHAAIQLENKKQQGIIESYKTPAVSLSTNDSSVCIVDVEFAVQKGINQIIVSAIINV